MTSPTQRLEPLLLLALFLTNPSHTHSRQRRPCEVDHLVQRGNLAVALVEVMTTQQLHEQHTTPHPSHSQPPPTPHIHTLAPHRLTHPFAPQQHLRTSVAQRRHCPLLSPPRRRTYPSLPHNDSTPVAQRDASTTVQDVRGLHIAVDDALCVRRLQHVQHLVQNRLQLALHLTPTHSQHQRKRITHRHQLLQRRLVQIRHHVHAPATTTAIHAVHGKDGAVVERLQRYTLTLTPLAHSISLSPRGH